MFGWKNGNSKSKNDKQVHVGIIRKAGYYLPDKLIAQTSLKNLHYAALTIKARSLILEEDMYDFNVNVHGDKFMTANTNEQMRISYSLYLAQTFADMLFNERTGVYIYQNKELLEFHDTYPGYFNGFIHGIIVLRELEEITSSYENSIDKKKYQPFITQLGEGIEDITLSLKMHNSKQALHMIAASHRGLIVTMIFGYGTGDPNDYNNNPTYALESAFKKSGKTSTFNIIPDLKISNWENFQQRTKSKYNYLNTQ